MNDRLVSQTTVHLLPCSSCLQIFHLLIISDEPLMLTDAPRYNSTLYCNETERIIFTTVDAPAGIQLHHVYHFVPYESGTQVIDDVTVYGNIFMRWYTVKQGQAAHQIFLSNLNKLDWKTQNS